MISCHSIKNAEEISKVTEFTGHKEAVPKGCWKMLLETCSGPEMKLKRKTLNSKNLDGSSKRYPWQKRSWMKKSESYKQEKKDGGRRASQANGCCFDLVVVEQLIMTGAGEAWQQIQALQGELHKRFEVQHLPAPATPVHMPEGGEGGDEDEEEQRKRAASRQMG